MLRISLVGFFPLYLCWKILIAVLIDLCMYIILHIMKWHITKEYNLAGAHWRYLLEWRHFGSTKYQCYIYWDTVFFLNRIVADPLLCYFERVSIIFVLELYLLSLIFNSSSPR